MNTHPIITKTRILLFVSLIGSQVQGADQAKIAQAMSQQAAQPATAALLSTATPAGNPAGATPTTSANTTPTPSPRITPTGTQTTANIPPAIVLDAYGQALGACPG